MKSVNDNCGVFGIFNVPDAARLTYFGLHALQHRGQESCGIVTSMFDEVRKRPIMPLHKDFGLVLDAFSSPSIFTSTLLGDAAIGHTRYSTSGASESRANIQPLRVQYKLGNLALSHNGNLSNVRELRESFSDRGTLFQSTSDSELVLHLIAQSRRRKQVDQILDALSQIEGGYALIFLTDTSLIAARDPNGFRPLALGIYPRPTASDAYCVASETCAFDLIGATYVREIEPGEVVVIDREHCESGHFESIKIPNRHGITQCIFEYVYFARPDSKVFGENVDKIRRRFGRQLANDAPVPRVRAEEKAPVVISVPDSSNTAALGYVNECQRLGYRCRYEIGLIRNHYVGRTFIAPGQDRREMNVRCKFNTVDGILKNRIVVVVDDSIVRGTTARLLVRMIRDAGAREVHFRVASPTVVSPCFYGMDFPSREELLSSQFANLEDLGNWLEVDSLTYLSVEGMRKVVDSTHESLSSNSFCDACFTCNYPVPIDITASKEEYD